MVLPGLIVIVSRDIALVLLFFLALLAGLLDLYDVNGARTVTTADNKPAFEVSTVRGKKDNKRSQRVTPVL